MFGKKIKWKKEIENENYKTQKELEEIIKEGKDTIFVPLLVSREGQTKERIDINIE